MLLLFSFLLSFLFSLLFYQLFLSYATFRVSTFYRIPFLATICRFRAAAAIPVCPL